MRYKLTIAYDGTAFHGWQRQTGPEGEPLRTVQGALETAVLRAIRQPVEVVGASRTDRGVHARGQVAAFTAEVPIPLPRLPRAINSRLPRDVQVRQAEVVDDAFNPIRDCTAKGYRFQIAHDCALNRFPPLFDRHIVTWTSYRLAPDRMHEAARHLVGEHDFASFTRAHHGRQSTVRTIHACTVRAAPDGRCVMDISGDGFLYNMVRIIAGTLVEVGRGVLAPADIVRILAAADRRAAGPTLPPEGLCLEWVEYGRRHEGT
jgi:tRNA pseudouridine38-40 synthase